MCESNANEVCPIEPDNHAVCRYQRQKTALIVCSVMFFLNMLIGMAVLVMYSRLPRDPCYPSNYAVQQNPLQVVYWRFNSHLNKKKFQPDKIIQLPNGQQVVLQLQNSQPKVIEQISQAAAKVTPVQKEVSNDEPTQISL